MKKKNAPIKVVAISSVAVLALAGISTVSILSLAKSPDGTAMSGVQNAELDTASAKAALREDPAAAAPVIPAAPVTSEQVTYNAVPETVEPASTYTVPVVFEPVKELVVMSTTVSVAPSPEEVSKAPVIATIQNVDSVQETALAAAEEPKEENVPVLEVADSPVTTELVEAAPETDTMYEVQEPVVQFAAAPAPAPEYDVPEYADLTAAGMIEVAADAPADDTDYDYGFDNDYDGADDSADDAADYGEFDPVDYSAYLNDYTQFDVTADATVAAEQEEVQQAEEISGDPASTTATGLRQQIVDFANSRVGVTPYVWAGRSLETGTDCSGFVNLVYNNFGLYASSGSDDYQNVEGGWGENISYNELQPGDVVVYRNGGHVGIYAGQDENGNDIVIHDSNEIDGVKVSDMNYSAPTAFVRVAGMDAAPASDTTYTDETEEEDDWYYAYDDESDSDYDESDYNDDYYDGSGYEDEDYGYWN